MATPALKTFEIEAASEDDATVTPILRTFEIEADTGAGPSVSPHLRTFAFQKGVPENLGTPETGQLFQVDGYTGGGGDSTLTAGISEGQVKLTVASPTGFTVDSFVEIKEGMLVEYGQIEAINGSDLILYHMTNGGAFAATTTTVKNVDVTQLSEGVDWTIVRSTGQITVLPGGAGAGKELFFRYSQVISDLGGYEAYRITGDHPLPDKALHDEVTGFGGVVTVDAAIGSGATSVQETPPSTENGKTWTYYLFSKDADDNQSRAQAVLIETLTSQVQNFQVTPGPEKATMSWDAVTDPNAGGVNIYRSQGSWDPAQALKVNSVPVSATSFVDGSDNVTNRRPPGEVPFPVSGQTYFYVAETEDSVTDWDTGTQNQSLDPLKAEVLTASKTDD